MNEKKCGNKIDDYAVSLGKMRIRSALVRHEKVIKKEKDQREREN